MQDLRCTETRLNRSTVNKNGEQVVAPILSLRNRPNNLGITFKFGKRAGQLKPFKHKDCSENV